MQHAYATVIQLLHTTRGTKLYKSPERILNENSNKAPLEDTRQLNVAGDVWALGVTLMELALGRHPIPQLSPEQQSIWLSSNRNDRANKFPAQNTMMNDIVLLAEMNRLSSNSVRLNSCKFSDDFASFVDMCLKRNATERATLSTLRQMDFITNTPQNAESYAKWVTEIVNKYTNVRVRKSYKIKFLSKIIYVNVETITERRTHEF